VAEPVGSADGVRLFLSGSEDSAEAGGWNHEDQTGDPDRWRCGVRFVKGTGDHDVERERDFNGAHDCGESELRATCDPGRDVAAYTDGERCVGHHEEAGRKIASEGCCVGERLWEEMQEDRIGGCFDGERNDGQREKSREYGQDAANHCGSLWSLIWTKLMAWSSGLLSVRANTGLFD